MAPKAAAAPGQVWRSHSVPRRPSSTRHRLEQFRRSLDSVDASEGAARFEAVDGSWTRACLPNLKVLTGDDWPVTRMGVISDEFWAAVESVMPSDVGKRGNRFGDHRLILEGIAWRFRTGSPWRDLPADFGPWQTVWKRHHRWSLDGTYDTMFAQVAAVFGVDAAMVEDLEKLLSVDSTSVRAHQHCAGARSDTLATGGSVELQESAR
jgi:putative transposase